MSFFVKRSPSGELTLEQGEPLKVDELYVVHKAVIRVPKGITNPQALSVMQAVFENLGCFLSFPTTSS